MSRPLAPAFVVTAALGGLWSAGPALAQSSTNPALGRPFFLAGRVLLEDGSPPPERVGIVRSCGGKAPVPQGFTDAEGRFSFEVGRSLSPLMDVQNQLGGDPFQSGYPDLTGCELRAVATGYSSDAVDLSSHRLLDSPDVGTIVLKRLDGVRGSVFSTTTLRAKEEARKAFEKGRDLGRKQKYDEAVQEYEKALRGAPGFAAAWFELGLVHQIQGHLEEAKKAYQESVSADPDFVKPYRQLAAISFQQQDWPAVVKATERLLWLDPVSYPEAWSYDAIARLYTGELEKAETSARKATELDPDGRVPRARYVLAAILIEEQDYAGAAEALRDYLAHAPPGPEADQARDMLGQVETRLGTSPDESSR